MMEHNSYWYGISVMCSILAFILTVVGTAVPMWVWMENDDDHLGIGLFHRVGYEKKAGQINTVPDFDNSGVKIEDRLTLDTDHWKAMAAFAIISCVCGVVLSLSLLYYRHRVQIGEYVGTLYAGVFTMSILTWLTNLIVLVVFMIYHGDALTIARVEINDESFSWCFIFFLFALFLGILVSLIMSFKLNPADRDAYRAPANYPKTEIDNRMFDDPYNPRYPRDDISLPGDNFDADDSNFRFADPRGMTRAPGDIADVRGPRPVKYRESPYLPHDHSNDRRPSREPGYGADRAASGFRDNAPRYNPRDQRSLVLSPSHLPNGRNESRFDPGYMYRPASDPNRVY